MSVLDDILARLPEDRHEQFVRVLHTLNVRDDSPDLIQAYLAIEAIGPMLDEMKRTSNDLPENIRIAGTEITKTLADDIAESASAKILQLADRIVNEANTSYQTELMKHAVNMDELLNANTKESAKLFERANQAVTAAAALPSKFTAQLSAYQVILLDTHDWLKKYFLIAIASFAAAFLGGACIGAGVSHFYVDHSTCVANVAHANSSHSQNYKNILVSEYCP